MRACVAEGIFEVVVWIEAETVEWCGFRVELSRNCTLENG